MNSVLKVIVTLLVAITLLVVLTTAGFLFYMSWNAVGPFLAQSELYRQLPVSGQWLVRAIAAAVSFSTIGTFGYFLCCGESDRKSDDSNTKALLFSEPWHWSADAARDNRCQSDQAGPI